MNEHRMIRSIPMTDSCNSSFKTKKIPEDE